MVVHVPLTEDCEADLSKEPIAPMDKTRAHNKAKTKPENKPKETTKTDENMPVHVAHSVLTGGVRSDQQSLRTAHRIAEGKHGLRETIEKAMMLTIYYALVSSVIYSGIGVWGLASSTHILKVQSLQDRCLNAVSWKENFKNNQIFANLKVLKVREMTYCNLIVKYKDNSKYITLDARKKTFHSFKKISKILLPKCNRKYGAIRLDIIIPKISSVLPPSIIELQKDNSFRQSVKNWIT